MCTEATHSVDFAFQFLSEFVSETFEKYGPLKVLKRES